MEFFQDVVKLRDPASEKYLSMHKIEIVRVIELKKIFFWSLQAINYFAAQLHYSIKC